MILVLFTGDHERVLTAPVQTRIGIRWVNLSSLHDHSPLIHTFE